MTSLSLQTAVQKNEAQSKTSYVLTALEHSHVLYFPNMKNAVHCSLIMHGFHNGKWLILCSKNRKNILFSFPI